MNGPKYREQVKTSLLINCLLDGETYARIDSQALAPINH